ncbi:MAG TPA: phosphatase PAP2 family protein [Alphaproteobacteria bacterium]|jgi:lipid A 4'-phosphatase|nr:phosphatase PAP2 family protein [Alphaproteobacteria bacterium]
MSGQGAVFEQGMGADWPADARLVAAYLLSSPRSNRIGCYRLDIDGIAAHASVSSERAAEIVALLEYDGFVRHDSDWVWIPDVLRRRPFSDSDEVRRTMSELAAVPREAGFREELVRQFRVSADRPGTPAPVKAGWLNDLVGDGRPAGLQPAAEGALSILDYLRRCRAFLLDLVNTRPLRILGMVFVVLAILFVVFPGIDLGVAGWFYLPPRHFVLGETWIGRFFDSDVHFGMEWFLPVIVGVFLYGLFRKRPIWNLTPRNFLFVVLTIALGAGLVTNVIFKDSWGRARPSQVMEFGGLKQFSPPFMRSTQCDKNCSFVSGDASLAASFLVFAMIARRNRLRWWVGLSGFTMVVGLMRMGRGSHFLSDVVFAIIFTLMIMLVLARLILENRWRDWPSWRGTTGG